MSTSIQLRNGLANELVDRVLEDLLARFVVNCPPEDLSSLERMCFQIEEACWFYQDFVRLDSPQLPGMKLVGFSNAILKTCPFLWKWGVTPEQAKVMFGLYKLRIPVRGACLFNASCSKVLLIQGTELKLWSFPRGKIGKGESDVECSVRETKEEIGFDILPFIDPRQYVERTVHGKNFKIYLVKGIPEDTLFVPEVRNEIAEIKWFDVKPLAKKVRSNPNRYFLVPAMLEQMLRFTKLLQGTLLEDQLKKEAEVKLRKLLGIGSEPPTVGNADAGRELLELLTKGSAQAAAAGDAASSSGPAPGVVSQLQLQQPQQPVWSTVPPPGGFPIPGMPFPFYAPQLVQSSVPPNGTVPAPFHPGMMVPMMHPQMQQYPGAPNNVLHPQGLQPPHQLQPALVPTQPIPQPMASPLPADLRSPDGRQMASPRPVLKPPTVALNGHSKELLLLLLPGAPRLQSRLVEQQPQQVRGENESSKALLALLGGSHKADKDKAAQTKLTEEKNALERVALPVSTPGADLLLLLSKAESNSSKPLLTRTSSPEPRSLPKPAKAGLQKNSERRRERSANRSAAAAARPALNELEARLQSQAKPPAGAPVVVLRRLESPLVTSRDETPADGATDVSRGGTPSHASSLLGLLRHKLPPLLNGPSATPVEDYDYEDYADYDDGVGGGVEGTALPASFEHFEVASDFEEDEQSNLGDEQSELDEVYESVDGEESALSVRGSPVPAVPSPVDVAASQQLLGMLKLSGGPAPVASQAAALPMASPPLAAGSNALLDMLKAAPAKAGAAPAQPAPVPSASAGSGNSLLDMLRLSSQAPALQTPAPQTPAPANPGNSLLGLLKTGPAQPPAPAPLHTQPSAPMTLADLEGGAAPPPPQGNPAMSLLSLLGRK